MEAVARDVSAASHTDTETLRCMGRVFDDSGYLMDPHTAVGYLALESAVEQRPEVMGILLATAHPVKFGEVVEEATGHTVDVPDRLSVYLEREPRFLSIAPDPAALREALEGG